VRQGSEWVLSPDSSIRLWDAHTGKQLKCLNGFKDSIYCVAFSPDGCYAIFCCPGQWKGDTYIRSSDYSVRLWDLKADREVTKLVSLSAPTADAEAARGGPRFQGHTDIVAAVVFSPDGRQVLSGGADRTLRLWDVATSKELRRLEGHTDTVTHVAFSHDGRRALSCGDRTVRLWDLETGRQLQCLQGHRDLIWTVAFSPDGKWAASAGGNQQANGRPVRGEADYDIRLWDLETGAETARLRGHHTCVRCVVFTPDSQRLVSCSGSQFEDEEPDNTIRIWDVETGSPLGCLTGHEGSVLRVAISPDGRSILSGGFDCTLRLWPLPARGQEQVRLP
jgi:WD40 repeat protein